MYNTQCWEPESHSVSLLMQAVKVKEKCSRKLISVNSRWQAAPSIATDQRKQTLKMPVVERWHMEIPVT